MTTTDPLADAVHRLEFDIDWAPGHAAAYLVAGDEPVLVDAGTPGETGRDELEIGLESYGYRPADVEHVLLTHAHSDHTGQVATLVEAGDPTVYAPTAIREWYRRDPDAVREATRANMLEAGVGPGALDRSVDLALDAYRTDRDAVDPDAVDVWLDASNTVGVGPLEVDPIYSPGHHVTHHCYATELDGESVLFSGDVAIEPFRAAAIHVYMDHGVAEGIPEFLDTLADLQSHSFDRVFPGHGPVHTNYRAALSQSIADLENQLEACHDRLRESGSTAMHVTSNLSEGFDDMGRLLPETTSALAALERQGRAHSWTDDQGMRFYAPGSDEKQTVPEQP